MPFAPELMYGVLLVLLFAGIAYGALRYRSRNKRLDPLSEQATKKVMDDPGPEPMKGDRPQPPGGIPPASRQS